MEKAGTGIQRITGACKANNNIVKFDFTDAFWITINSNEINVPLNVPLNVPKEKRLKLILDLIKENPGITQPTLASEFNVDIKTIKRDMEKLKAENKVIRIGGSKDGYWEIIDEK